MTPKKSAKALLDSLLPPVRVFGPHRTSIPHQLSACEVSSDGKVCRTLFDSNCFARPFDDLPDGTAVRIWPNDFGTVSGIWKRVDCVKVGKYVYWWADYDCTKHDGGLRGPSSVCTHYIPTAKEALYAR